MREDHGIANLLDLHDQIIDQDGGYWVKIEAWEVQVSEAVPHGVRYSLTLHNPRGLRILGYDNAHGFHHRHYMGKIEAVAFVSFELTSKLFTSEWIKIASSLNAKGTSS